MMRVLLVSGSVGAGSLHTAALRTLALHAPPGAATSLYGQLRDLPAFDAGLRSTPEPVQVLRRQVTLADAALFCTPEYAGSLPGSLKNLLDWLVDGGQLTGKPVAWLSVAGHGEDDGARATLETVLSHAGARLQQAACIRIPLAPSSVDADGLIPDARLHTAMLDMLDALSRSSAPQLPPAAQPNWQTYSSVFPVITPRGPAGPPSVTPPGSAGGAQGRPWSPYSGS